MVTAFVFFLVGGIEALLIRIQLGAPDNTFLTPEKYNQLFTMHGTTMIFLFVVPMMAGFGELLRAADDRRARHGLPAPERAVSYWLFLFGAIVLLRLAVLQPARGGLDQLHAAVLARPTAPAAASTRGSS